MWEHLDELPVKHRQRAMNAVNALMASGDIPQATEYNFAKVRGNWYVMLWPPGQMSLMMAHPIKDVIADGEATIKKMVAPSDSIIRGKSTIS